MQFQLLSFLLLIRYRRMFIWAQTVWWKLWLYEQRGVFLLQLSERIHWKRNALWRQVHLFLTRWPFMWSTILLQKVSGPSFPRFIAFAFPLRYRWVFVEWQSMWWRRCLHEQRRILLLYLSRRIYRKRNDLWGYVNPFIGSNLSFDLAKVSFSDKFTF